MSIFHNFFWWSGHCSRSRYSNFIYRKPKLRLKIGYLLIIEICDRLTLIQHFRNKNIRVASRFNRLICKQVGKVRDFVYVYDFRLWLRIQFVRRKGWQLIVIGRVWLKLFSLSCWIRSHWSIKSIIKLDLFAQNFGLSIR